jgi:hypothetical protein
MSHVSSTGELNELPKCFGCWLILYVLMTSYPRGVIEGNPVLSRMRALFARWHGARPEELPAGSFAPPPAPPPRTRVGGAAPPGGRRRASRRLYSVRTPPWVVGAGSGRVHGPKFAAGTATGAAGGFLRYWEGDKSVEFFPLSGAHQARGRYALCLAIHCAEGVRRVRKGDFWKCV